MRVFVAWDDPEEAETLELILGAAALLVVVRTGPAALREALSLRRDWDVVVFPIPVENDDATMAEFRRLRTELPETPIVAACHLKSMIKVVPYLAQGLRSYVVRDERNDFMMLLNATLTSTVEAVQAERERQVSSKLREEVESVRLLQEAMIPRELPTPTGYDICGRYEASQLHVLGGRSVVLAGGDYYDVFQGDENSTFVLLGDAAGHGMKACLSIMIMHTLVQMIRDRRFEDTATFVTAVNRHLCAQPIIQQGGGFITLLFGKLCSATHEFEWTSAGHPVPMLHRLDDDAIVPLGSKADSGLALGIMDDAEYTAVRSPIPLGSRILLYTDGLEEAFPSGQEECCQFGVAGISAALRASRRGRVDEAMELLFAASNAHTAGAGRHDDTTAVIVERTS